jgi:hypothetical protein
MVQLAIAELPPTAHELQQIEFRRPLQEKRRACGRLGYPCLCLALAARNERRYTKKPTYCWIATTITSGMKHFSLNPIEIQIRWYAQHIKLFRKYGNCEDCFLNKLKDKDITEEMQDFLKVRFSRMTERQQKRIIFKCKMKKRKILSI